VSAEEDNLLSPLSVGNIAIPYISDEQAAAVRDPQLKLLFRLAKFSLKNEGKFFFRRQTARYCGFTIA
jgi:hypothetical protein